MNNILHESIKGLTVFGKDKSSYKRRNIWKFIFVIIYVITMLPFTLNFFNETFNINNSDKLWGVFPVVQLHAVILPIFLFVIELTALTYAGFCTSNFASKKYGKGFSTLLIFFCLELIPVGAMYIDSMHNEYEINKKNRQEKIQAEINENNAQLQTVNDLLNENKKGTNKLMTNFGDISRRISRDSIALNALSYNLNTLVSGDIRSKKEIENKVLTTIDSLYKVRAKSYSQTIPSFYEWLPNNIAYGKSLAAAIVALIFSLTTFAFGYAFRTHDNDDSGTLEMQSPDFQISILEKMPPDSQKYYVKKILPSIRSYILGWKAADLLTNNWGSFYNEMQAYKKYSLMLISLKETVERSTMNKEAKQKLNEEIDKLININIGDENGNACYQTASAN